MSGREHQVGPYVAVEAGEYVGFWDAEAMLFNAPASVANCDAARTALALAYEAGKRAGEVDGVSNTQAAIRNILGIQP